MFLAASEPFWKSPNVYDVAGLAGFVIGIGSIWFSWRLARIDISKRVNEAADRAAAAAREEVRRVAETLLRASILDTTRTLELAREACRGRQWTRAVDLCLQSLQELERLLAGQIPVGMAGDELRQLSTNLKDCVARLREQPRPGTGIAPKEVSETIDAAILAFHRLHGLLTDLRSEGQHERSGT